MKNVFLIVFIGVALVISSCKKKNLNEDLYEESKAPELVFYQGKDSILSPAGGSPHGPFKLKFNATAVSQFGNDGKLPLGGTFKEGALIVKEIYSGGQLSLYAVMKKEDSKFAANGWLWSEYEPDGKTKYSVGKKGTDCVSCHSAASHRDLTRSFDLH